MFDSVLVISFGGPNGPAARVGAATDFAIPVRLKTQVDFWIGVFATYGKRQVVIHDTERLDRVYSVLDFSDLMIFSMALPNLVGVVLLSGRVRRALDDYWRRYRAGEFQPRR